jgi:glutamate/tyrosine decarboxylase-like PLP-dependent enzyme
VNPPTSHPLFRSEPLYVEDSAVAVAPAFQAGMAEIRARYFSRDPNLWPVFRDPGLQRLAESRRHHAPAPERLAAYPGGAHLLEALKADHHIPENGTAPGGVHESLLFAAALSKAWENPASVENVVTMPSDPAIYGAMLGVAANPNLVYHEYSEVADELEKTVIRQIAQLVGYDPAEATGVFTQGGTFCNLYGYLLGIRKTLPEALHLGLEHGQDYRIINSQGGHYSNTTNLSLLGVNIARKTIRVRVTRSHDIDIKDLEDQLAACFRLGCLVPCIMLTMGTTDTFGVDQVKPVYDLCRQLCVRFGVTKMPHIHVDSAVGWPLIFFLDYDFAANPLAINPATLASLRRNVDRFRELRYADSFTVDFQKWGFVPYTSSLVMIKEQASLRALEHDPENFSYFEKDTQGQTHFQSTIECSRGAAGLFGAYAALQYLGKRGYQILIAHGLQNANYFRHRLAHSPGALVIAPQNQGPSVGFRLYDRALVADPAAELAFEKEFDESEAHRARVSRNNAYHRGVFLRRGKQGLYTNWVQFVTNTNYSDTGAWAPLPGEKAVFMNPMTDAAHIDRFIARLHAT